MSQVNKKIEVITQEEVKKLFNYKDGKLFWKVSPANHIKIGNEAGHLTDEGYNVIVISGKRYYTHRLIFLYYYGYLPEYLDHINNIRDDNRINNLREASRNQNQWNKKKQKNKSSSKYKGVHYFKGRKRWRARIQVNGKSKHLGYYFTEEEAALSYNEAAIKYFGKYAELNEMLSEEVMLLAK